MKKLFKVLKIAIGTIIIGFLILSTISFFMRPGSPPSVKDAPWAIQTYIYNDGVPRIPSRYYYAEKIQTIDGVNIAMEHWWDFDGKRYHKHSGDKPFPEKDYGIVEIIRR